LYQKYFILNLILRKDGHKFSFSKQNYRKKIAYEQKQFMKLPRVLMFGWEFPPAMSGGLGVACLGLCRALAPLVDLRMIIPKITPDFVMKNMDLVGMNTVSIRELKKIHLEEFYEEIGNVEYLDYALSPYASSFDYDSINEARHFLAQNTIDTVGDPDHFSIDELYGGDVIKKVIEFGKLAVRLGLTKQFDVIHAHDWMTFIPGMHLKAITGKPLVLHVHSLEYDRGGKDSHGWVYHLEKKAMEAADIIIPVSYYTGDICHKHYGIPTSKIFPVHNGIDPVDGHEHLNGRSFPESLVLFLGRVTMQKGPQFYVETAKKVLRSFPDVHFVLAGSGNQTRELIEYTAEHGMGNKFHFTGFVNKKQVNELLSMTDVYCMPSVSEPFGLSAVEAVQFEIPCVISQRSGVSEVLKGALKADFWDTDKFADYIIALLRHDTLRKELVEEANNDLKDIHWEGTAEKVVSIYNSIINK
jgi:glycogen(starch) synthase